MQGQPSQVVELQQGLVEGLVNLHVLLLGTGQGLCEGRQHVRRGRGDTKGGLDGVHARQTWSGLEAKEDTSVLGPEGPIAGANGWTDQDRHGCLTQGFRVTGGGTGSPES